MNETNLTKKVGQLMVFGFSGITPSSEIKELIRDYHIGGIILFGRNIGTAQEVLDLTRDLQKVAKEAGHDRPLLICIDQENGIVRRLGEGTTFFPGSMLIGATGKNHNAYEVGLATGRELNSLGINWNLAPVVDINNNSLNPVIGVRSFGEDADLVTRFCKANIKGMQDAGIITTLKHFPGHGDTDSDSHLDLPVISHSMDRLNKVELKPFRECIEDGADTIMSAHVYFPALVKDKTPATLSKEVITGLLREEIGFQGVVTTDCMEMNAIANTCGTVAGAVKAIKAGVDVVMISHSHDLQKQAIEEIVKEVQAGKIKECEINESYSRVEALKEKYLSWDHTYLDTREVSSVVACEEHKQLAERLFKQGVTIGKDDNILPLSNENSHKVLVVYPSNSKITGVEDRKYADYSLEDVVREIHPVIEAERVSNNPTEGEIKKVLKKSKDFETIIVGTLTAKPGSNQLRLIKQLTKRGSKVVVIAMRSPYDLAYMPDIKAFVTTYEFTRLAIKVAVKGVYGIEEVSGKLPVTVLEVPDSNKYSIIRK